MAMTRYKAKLNFKESPEPTGGKPTGDNLKFVIQKHNSANSHYDFRLMKEGSK